MTSLQSGETEPSEPTEFSKVLEKLLNFLRHYDALLKINKKIRDQDKRELHAKVQYRANQVHLIRLSDDNPTDNVLFSNQWKKFEMF